MLHGFDAGDVNDDVGTGDEVYAYVPNKIIDSTERFANDLDQLTSLVYAHRFFVDLTPQVEDVYMRANSAAASDSWNTVMMGGLGGGGKGYFLLNVTDPDASFATVTAAKGTAMWEFTDEDDTYPVDADGDPLVDGSGDPLVDLAGDPVKDLGYAFSIPTLVMTNADDGSGNKIWAAIFGNGYNSTAGIAKLFILDLEAGLNDWQAGDFMKLSTGEGAKSVPDLLAGLPNGLGSPAVVDKDGNGTGDLVFAGDLFGNLYRFDISDADPSNWTTTKLFQATYDGTLATRQPITTAPFVYKHPDQTGYVVVVTTGSYITEQDGISRDIQSVYGIWDRGEANPATAASDAKSTRLVEQELTNLVDESNTNFLRQRIVSGNAVAYTPDAGLVDGVYGWYFDFDMPRADDTLQGNPNPDTTGDDPPAAQFPGERAIRRIVPRGDSLLITTIIPRDNNTCFRAPPGSTFPIDRLTGGNPRRAILDINNDGYVDDNDLITYNGQT
jgi:type IV pilus assembly protein PilY1